MALPTWIAQHFPAHGNWYGLRLGWGSTLWLSAIVSRGDPRLAHGEPWVGQRLLTLKTATAPQVERLECTDERLEIVLRHFSDDSRWAPCESPVHPHTVRGYERRTERGHVDRTPASAYASVREEGWLPFGPRKDHRPDGPQGKGRQAVRDPLGMPLATEVVAGERADAPLSGPCRQRVQTRVGRSGLRCVGDGKRAAQATRTFMALAGEDSWCPRPQGPLAEGELEEALARVWSGAPALRSVWRAQEQGAPQRRAQGYARAGPMSVEVEGKRRAWSERRLRVRSGRPAEAAEGALRARVAKAKAHGEALTPRGRGRPRFADVATLRQSVNAMVQRHRVEDFVWLQYDHPTPPRPVRAYQPRPAYGQAEHQATGEVRVDEAALESAVRRCGWRIDRTHQPSEARALAPAVLAYRRAYQGERSLGRRKGRPRSLRPMSVQRDDHATGLMRW